MLRLAADTSIRATSVRPTGPNPPRPRSLGESVPREYHDYLDVFSEEQADVLPPHRPYDHKIIIEDGATPPHGRIYSMSELELRTLRDHLEKELAKGFIRPSSSPAGAQVLFFKRRTDRYASASTITG